MNADKVRSWPMVLVLPRPRISTFICGSFFFDFDFGDSRGVQTIGTSPPSNSSYNSSSFTYILRRNPGKIQGHNTSY
jgi:hypothetical protein